MLLDDSQLFRQPQSETIFLAHLDRTTEQDRLGLVCAKEQEEDSPPYLPLDRI
jgi:hypothetical protein